MVVVGATTRSQLPGKLDTVPVSARARQTKIRL
jgi:hypothetical protein